MAVAEGRFERKKIESYSEHFGTLKTANGKTIYAVNLSNPLRTAYFTFLRDDEVAICNDASCFFSGFRKIDELRGMARAFSAHGWNADSSL